MFPNILDTRYTKQSNYTEYVSCFDQKKYLNKLKYFLQYFKYFGY